jgi:hypothetical protein
VYQTDIMVDHATTVQRIVTPRMALAGFVAGICIPRDFAVISAAGP